MGSTEDLYSACRSLYGGEFNEKEKLPSQDLVDRALHAQLTSLFNLLELKKQDQLEASTYASLQTNIRHLQAHETELSSQLEMSEKALAHTQSEIKKTQGDLLVMKNENEQVVHELYSKVLAAERKLKDAKGVQVETASQLAETKRKLTEAEGERHRLSDSLLQAETEVANLRGELERASQTADAAKLKYDNTVGRFSLKIAEKANQAAKAAHEEAFSLAGMAPDSQLRSQVTLPYRLPGQEKVRGMKRRERKKR